MNLDRRGFLSGMIGFGAVALSPRTGAGKELACSGGLKRLGPIITDWEYRRNSALSGRCAAMYIDDVIWLFRDLARQRPKSMFEHPFLATLKSAHDRYGLKVQLNCFYRTDVFYGMDEFSLAEMTAAYKGEWQASKDWLRLGFHAYQEFPDYPFINASYADVAKVFDRICGEVRRFAGDGVFTFALVGHWLPVSKAGCRALKDRGVKLIASTDGTRYEYGGDRSVLPYGHAMRVESNRTPECALYRREAYQSALLSSACSYNHVTGEQNSKMAGRFDYLHDRDLGVGFKRFRSGPMINLCPLDKIPEEMAEAADCELLAFADHEQYFYRDYFAYQPDHAERILLTAKIAHNQGRRYIFIEDLVS